MSKEHDTKIQINASGLNIPPNPTNATNRLYRPPSSPSRTKRRTLVHAWTSLLRGVVPAYFDPELRYIAHRLPAGRIINVHVGFQGVHAHTIHVAMMSARKRGRKKTSARWSRLLGKHALFLFENVRTPKTKETTTQNWNNHIVLKRWRYPVHRSRIHPLFSKTEKSTDIGWPIKNVATFVLYSTINAP